MTTTEAPKQTELQKGEQIISKVWTFDKTHVVLIVTLFLSLLGGVYLYDSRRAVQADARAAIAEATGQQADAANIKNQAALAAQLQALQDQNANLSKEVSSLEVTMATRDVALARQQQTVTNLPPIQIASKWQDLIAVPGSVAVTNNGYSVTTPGAVATVQALMSVDTLKKDKADLQTENKDLTQKAANSDAALGVETKAHQADNSTCKQDLATAAAVLKKTKADARRSKFRWFFAGLVTGIVGGHAAGI